ncbi:MAG: hypothetical protein ER33_00645 [Cyanobium sp. CACIAM 14]|nr:MAG: hypothetical protein ER33_00645 [Cyanobium sp. CACIAM 14]
MPEKNIKLIRRGYEAYTRGDFASVFALLHPEVEICQSDLLPWGGIYRGHEQAREFFHRLNESTEGLPCPEEFIAAGGDVVVIGRLQGRTRVGGQTYDLRIVHLWSIEGEQVVRFAAYIDTPGMLKALTGD